MEYVAYVVGITYALWIFFLSLMPLKKARDEKTISKPALVLAAPILIIGAIIDFSVNMVVFTFIFAELPKELLVTTRLRRLISGDNKWRTTLAQWICTNLLDTFDPSGCHCNKL